MQPVGYNSVAQGLAFWAVLACGYALGHLALEPSFQAPSGALVTVCKTPVEIVQGPDIRLGDASEDRLKPWGAQAADRMVWQNGRFQRQPEALRAAWQLLCGGRLNLNTATASDLQLIHGLGPHLSNAIVHNRKHAGPFKQLQDLTRVPGIAHRTFKHLEPWLRVDGCANVETPIP